MRHFVILLLLSFFTVNSYTQSLASLNSGGTDESGYSIVLPCDPNVKIPVVNVEIAGKQYRFLFDTGAGTSISRKLLDEIKPKLMGRVKMGDSEAKSDSMGVYSMPEITLDGVTFKDIPSVFLPDSEIFVNLGLDGVIGSNLIRNSVVRFSSPDKTIMITDDPAKFELDKLKSTTVNLTPEQSLPIIKTFLVDKGYGDVELLFDSGSSDLYNIAQRHLLFFRERGMFNEGTISEGIGSGNYTFFGPAPDVVKYRLRLPELKVANSTLKNVMIVATTNENSRMGAALLNYGNVTIDFINKRFYFEPFLKENDLYSREMPVDIVPRGNKFVIGVIWNKALMEKISLGDHVLSINGVNLEGFDERHVFLAHLDFSTKDSFLFRLRDKDGNEKEVQIDKE